MNEANTQSLCERWYGYYDCKGSCRALWTKEYADTLPQKTMRPFIVIDEASLREWIETRLWNDGYGNEYAYKEDLIEALLPPEEDGV